LFVVCCLLLDDMLRFLRQGPYIILSLLVFVFELFYILKSKWTNDFWEHSAAVNELSRNLFHPSNPIINENIPHAFYSPYTFLVAVFSKITHLNSIVSLQCFALFNLVFFLLAFYLFCKSIFKVKHQAIATFGLLFVLFFWGLDPSMWSGFYHIMVLNYVLPYPSTFAISLSFLILSMVAAGQKQMVKPAQTVLLIFLNAIVFITHPMTAVFLYTAIVVMTFTFNNYSVKQCFVRSIIIVLPAILLTMLWPYYNIADLLHNSNPDFDIDSKTLYIGILQRFWPALFAIPGMVIFIKEKTINFLSLTMILMVLICWAGWLSGIYGVSRILSDIMILAQISLGCLLVFCIRDFKLWSKIFIGLTGIAFSVSVYVNGQNLIRTWHFNGTYVEDIRRYGFIRDCIADNDLVLSDEFSNWYIPSFGGKVIASRHPLYWVKDLEPRRNAVKVFFANESSDSARFAIINKYKPTYILIDHSRTQLADSTITTIVNKGKEIYKSDGMELIKVDTAVINSWLRKEINKLKPLK